jgi:tRNA(Ile)-lysidine synthase
MIALEPALAAAPPGPLRLGFSGGLDSTVLLHLLASDSAARARGLGAIHVDHGLHPASAEWARHCERICARLALPLQVVRVVIEDANELGLEGAARRARQTVFAQHLPPGGLLALAHHRDDQAETLLLRLLHGAGHEGLAGMRALRTFARGWLWRPLLNQDRAGLRDWAQSHQLEWIEDPSNADPRHARNHLRGSVLPALAARWPDATRRIAASASRLRSESEVLDQAARQALALAQGIDPATLSVEALRRQLPALRRAVLGRWLDQLGLPRPPPGIWNRLEPDLLDARRDAAPLLGWRGAELRRHRTLLYAMRPLVRVDHAWQLPWDGSTPLALPAGFGALSLTPPQSLGAWIVRPRHGGERLQQPGAHRELRTLLQDLGVPPWQRERLPLLCSLEGEVLAAADLALAPSLHAALHSAGARLHWRTPN